jgi:hypothetical protein
LSFRQDKGDGFAPTVTNSMEFRVQAAFRPTNTAGKSPFLSRLAAVL